MTLRPVRYYVTEHISGTRSRTPEGFLLSEGAALARTGELLYGPNETPIKVGPNNIAVIERHPEDVFHPDAMASAVGKPVCNEHPPEDVTPDNWKKLSVGVILNPRRGKGPDSDLFLADLLITDHDAIKLIEDGKVELSCGYNADYDDVSPGRGKQSNIIINHVALVDSGRCGPRCAIGDHATVPIKETSTMARTTDRAKSRVEALRQKVTAAFNADDDKALEAAFANFRFPTADENNYLKEGEEEAGDEHEGSPEGGHHIHLHIGTPHDDDGTTDDDDGKRHSRRHHDDDDDDDDEGKRHSRRRHHDDDEGEPDPMEKRLLKLEETVAGLAKAVQKMMGAERAEAEHLEAHDDDGEEEDLGPDDEHSEKEDLEQDPDDPEGFDEIKGATGDDDDDDDDDAHYKGKTTDSAPVKLAQLARTWQRTLALAEILAPGMKMPTHDASNAKRTTAAICRVRRTALQTGYKDSETRDLIRDVVGGPLKLTDMTCDAVGVIFRGAAALKRTRNNQRYSRQETAGGGGLGVVGPIRTPAEWNARYAKN